MKQRNIFKAMFAGLVLAAACLFYFSCNKSAETAAPTSLQPHLKTLAALEGRGDFQEADGIFRFRSLRLADSVSRMLDSLPYDDLLALEKQNGFTSMMSVYLKCIDEMDSAKTRGEYESVKEKYADILWSGDSTVGANFSLTYATVMNRDGLFHAGGYLVSAGRDYLLMVKNGTKEDIARYATSEESFNTGDVVFRKYGHLDPSSVAAKEARPDLKTGVYCGYGWYGGGLLWACYNYSGFNKRITFHIFMDRMDSESETTCDKLTYYYYTVTAEAHKKNLFGEYAPFKTHLYYWNCKFEAIYPIELDNVPCEPCPGYSSLCDDWDCETEEVFVETNYASTKRVSISTGHQILGGDNNALLNPLSPNMITDDPKFIRVHGEATFPEMDGITCIINYGYPGTTGMYCD